MFIGWLGSLKSWKVLVPNLNAARLYYNLLLRSVNHIHVFRVRLIENGLQAGLGSILVWVFPLNELKKSVRVDLCCDECWVTTFKFKRQRVHLNHLRYGIQKQNKYGIDTFAGDVAVGVGALTFVFISNSKKCHALSHEPTTAFFISLYLLLICFLFSLLFHKAIAFI